MASESGPTACSSKRRSQASWAIAEGSPATAAARYCVAASAVSFGIPSPRSAAKASAIWAKGGTGFFQVSIVMTSPAPSTFCWVPIPARRLYAIAAKACG